MSECPWVMGSSTYWSANAKRTLRAPSECALNSRLPASWSRQGYLDIAIETGNQKGKKSRRRIPKSLLTAVVENEIGRDTGHVADFTIDGYTQTRTGTLAAHQSCQRTLTGFRCDFCCMQPLLGLEPLVRAILEPPNREGKIQSPILHP